ncbi:MAG: hypothetical protein KDE27_03045 [Planctomycetes bacterium]|nr:hypothetical protein [Planctomycetota bacterium]
MRANHRVAGSCRRLVRACLTAVWLATAVVPAQTRGTTQRTPGLAPFDPAVAFLERYGLANFPTQYVEALSTFLRAEQQFEVGNVGYAKSILDALWARYPVAAPSWGALPTRPFGIFIGSPPAYYGLRMLSDVVDWHVAHPNAGPPLRSARLTVVLVGWSAGIEPRTLSELTQGTGVPVAHALDPALLANNSAVIHESLELLRHYVVAITQGKLALDVRVRHLPSVFLPVSAGVHSGSTYFAQPSDPSMVWSSVTPQDQVDTDWWWVIYPSHVPEQYPAFANAEFITGGMGAGPNAGSPMFLIDDRWLVRKPPHLGSGVYSSVERRAYLPQWLQHELFHHLFRTWPQFGLENTPHQWFNPALWPADFVGRYETDYFHEAVYKRLQGASPALVAGLRYATTGAQWNAISLTDVLGAYQHSPVQNAWHLGRIQLGPQLEWRNQAGVRWNLQADLANGQLLTGPDCPYFGSWSGNRFQLVLRRDALGDLLPVLYGFGFGNGIYERTGP